MGKEQPRNYKARGRTVRCVFRESTPVVSKWDHFGEEEEEKESELQSDQCVESEDDVTYEHEYGFSAEKFVDEVDYADSSNDAEQGDEDNGESEETKQEDAEPDETNILEVNLTDDGIHNKQLLSRMLDAVDVGIQKAFDDATVCLITQGVSATALECLQLSCKQQLETFQQILRDLDSGNWSFRESKNSGSSYASGSRNSMADWRRCKKMRKSQEDAFWLQKRGALLRSCLRSHLMNLDILCTTA